MNTITVNNDISFEIATAINRKSKIWQNSTVSWSALLNRLATPTVTDETYDEYIHASAEVQGNIKDVGAFVGGLLMGGRRNKNSVMYRQLIALDIDFSTNEFWSNFCSAYICAAAIYSTHKSCPRNPRHRLLIPLDRKVNQEEYEAISRKIAGKLNIDLFDKSTFEFNRMMYWPSVPKDIEYYFRYQDGSILCADDVLREYGDDWHNVELWPHHIGFDDQLKQDVKEQEDPLTKGGIIGAFCRTYSISQAIAKFLPDVYEPNGTTGDRYTYIGGSTYGGMITYDDKFAYSYHATDPANEKLCNAFDLVRIHKFGGMDKGQVKDETLSKSFKAMEEFASKDSEVKKRIFQENIESAKSDFSDGFVSPVRPAAKALQQVTPVAVQQQPQPQPQNNDWVSKLETNKKGEFENTASNLNIIFNNDPILKDILWLNIFDNKRYIVRSVPWRQIDGAEPIKDVDYAGIRNYIECAYKIVSNQKIDDVVSLQFEKNKYHPIRNYINSLVWDGKPRINTLLQDYFGADDNAYTSAAIRKMLCAAVARVYKPGTKFDLVLILVGPQGSFKSTFIKKLGRQWFSDTFTTVQGKESFEQIQGFWIIEMAELSGLRKAEVELIKCYVSKCEDSFRPAYARVVETYYRQCVFFGTTNNKDFLRDPTGNRRFLPIDVHVDRVKKSVATDLTDYEVNQIWAEAYQLYLAGEKLYLDKDISALATDEQKKHSEVDERRGTIERYLDLILPDNWDIKTMAERRQWVENDAVAMNNKIGEKRNEVCVAEIWYECLGNAIANMTRYNTRDINDIMRSMDGWKQNPYPKETKYYGKQRFYVRIQPEVPETPEPTTTKNGVPIVNLDKFLASR